MGRPVKRDVAGTLVFGDYTTTAVGIKVTAYFGGSSRTDVFVVKQKGARRYLVQDKSDSTQAVCKLVSGNPAANGEMNLVGFTAPTEVDANVVVLRNLKKRTATDFNNNRYTWILVNDSTADYIQLTLISDGNS
jgi:hypothetical protein